MDGPLLWTFMGVIDLLSFSFSFSFFFFLFFFKFLFFRNFLGLSVSPPAAGERDDLGSASFSFESPSRP